MEPITGIFHDAQTGETLERELTAEEIAAIEVKDDVVQDPATVETPVAEEPTVDDLVEGEQP